MAMLTVRKTNPIFPVLKDPWMDSLRKLGEGFDL